MRDIKACIWDLDYTLYHSVEKIIPGFMMALITVLREQGITPEQLSDESIQSIAEHEFYARGSCYHYFTENFRIPYAFLSKEVPEHMYPNKLVPCTKLPECFAASPLTHFINTHAHEVWAERVLRHLNLDCYFPTQRIVYHHHHDHADKAHSPRTHEAALALTRCDANNVVMIDDMPKNLRIPKEMGMKTIWIDRFETGDKPTDADAVVTRAADVFTLLAA